MKTIYLSLGSNLDDRDVYLTKAVSAIENDIGQILGRSAVYETKAWGYKSENNFLNMALIADTLLKPEELLSTIKDIELSMGRKINQEGYSDREIDIDIIFYADLILKTDNLIIPHSLMHKRSFVLEPLNEIAPDFVHPVLQKTIRELLQDCSPLQRGSGQL